MCHNRGGEWQFTDRTEVAHNCTKPFKAPYCWIEESFLKKIEMQNEALIVQENYLLLFELCI